MGLLTNVGGGKCNQCYISMLWKRHMKTTVHCPKCGQENPPELIFCNARRRRWLLFRGWCAAVLYPVLLPCPACGGQQPGNARYCGRCGSATGRGTEFEEIER